MAATAYEIALCRDDGRSWCLNYSERLTAQCLRNNIGFRRQQIRYLLSDLPSLDITGEGKLAGRWPYVKGEGFMICYTGRTRREAERCADVPWIGAVEVPAWAPQRAEGDTSPLGA